MPELPEVEVMRRGLEKVFAGKPSILKIQFMRKDLRDPMPIAKIQKLIGGKIIGIHRRAKYLLIETDKGGLLSHLGMTGTWRLVADLNLETRIHDHIFIHLSDGKILAFNDPRRFGIFEMYPLDNPDASPRLKTLGPEPLEESFNGKALWEKLRGKKTALKVAIMDQKIVVGVGNIYASEALFRAKIKPTLRADKLSLERAEVLTREIKKVLTLAIQSGGSSISDFKTFHGDKGGFQNQFLVYDRAGEPCVVCSKPLLTKVIAGRSTYWCTVCQR
jgi:formamidopyrimidine-DNA glycosylase